MLRFELEPRRGQRRDADVAAVAAQQGELGYGGSVRGASDDGRRLDAALERAQAAREADAERFQISLLEHPEHAEPRFGIRREPARLGLREEARGHGRELSRCARLDVDAESARVRERANEDVAAVRNAERRTVHAMGLAVARRLDPKRRWVAPGVPRERVAQQGAAREVLGAAPCVHRGYHALPIFGRHERRDGGVGKRAPVGVVELCGAGAARHDTRRKISEVLIPPNAKLLLITYSVPSVRGAATM